MTLTVNSGDNFNENSFPSSWGERKMCRGDKRNVGNCILYFQLVTFLATRHIQFLLCLSLYFRVASCTFPLYLKVHKREIKINLFPWVVQGLNKNIYFFLFRVTESL